VTRNPITWILVCVAAVLLASAGPATAHSYLRSSTPADGAVLTAPPRVVVLTFTDPLVPSSAALTIATTTGAEPLRPRVSGNRITADWPAGLPAGRYGVNYRAASQDGHVMQGGITFRIAGGGAASQRSSPVATPSAVPYAQPAEAAGGDTTTAPATVPAWVWALGGALLVAAMAMAIVARRRR